MKKVLILLLLSVLGCSQPRTAATALPESFDSIPSNCQPSTDASAFAVLIIQGDIESIMKLADNAGLDVDNASNSVEFVPLVYRRCNVSENQAVVIEYLTLDQAERLQRLFELNIEGAEATIYYDEDASIS